MSRAAHPDIDEFPTDYMGLVRYFPLRPMHDQTDVDNATEIIDALAGADLTQDQGDYLDVLSDLVDKYEQEHAPQLERKHDPLGNLHFLMEQHVMSASDLGRVLGLRQLGAKLMSGERKLSKTHIRKLADYFHVSTDLFL